MGNIVPTDAELFRLALLVAQHEVMRDRLIQLGEINQHSVPLCWNNGVPIVNLQQVIAEFMESKKE